MILKGKTEPINVFEPVPHMDEETLTRFEEAYASLESGKEDAVYLYSF